MTPEQITLLLNILSDLPIQGLLALFLIILYRDAQKFREAYTAWLMAQITAYMEQHREIVRSVVVTPHIPTAPKYGSVQTP